MIPEDPVVEDVRRLLGMLTLCTECNGHGHVYANPGQIVLDGYYRPCAMCFGQTNQVYWRWHLARATLKLPLEDFR